MDASIRGIRGRRIAVRDCWVTPKPRVPNLEEVAKLLGPRESADFYSAEDLKKGAISVEF